MRFAIPLTCDVSTPVITGTYAPVLTNSGGTEMKILAILAFLFAMGTTGPDSVVTTTTIRTEFWATQTGTKYHRSGCRYLRESRFPVTVDEIQKRKLEPCLVCKPDPVVP